MVIHLLSLALFHGGTTAARPAITARSAVAVATAASKEIDVEAIGKYAGAVAVQMGAVSATFGAVDLATDALGVTLPWQAVAGLFWGLSLKSRVFSPLDNARPDLKKAVDGESTRGFNDRIMPSWTPPGVTFPIMCEIRRMMQSTIVATPSAITAFGGRWVLVVGPLRALSSTLVWEATGMHLLNPVLLCIMLHLSVGDTWNTVNNVERRLGAAVPGVACVLASACFAATQFYSVSEKAGSLLGLTAVWITVAGLLIADTWRINAAEAGSKWEGEPLFPVKGEVATRFWFEK